MNNFSEKYTLSKKAYQNEVEVSSVEIKFEVLMLHDVVDELDRFLKASGFCYHGKLSIVSDDDEIL